MRTSIETVGGNDPRIFAMGIIEAAEESQFDIAGGELDRIAALAQVEGRLTCHAACELEGSASRTGDGMMYQIELGCRALTSKCAGRNPAAVCDGFGIVLEVTDARGIKDTPIDDWSNLQSRPFSEAVQYMGAE